jgi:phosphohistidine phosphatase
MRQASPQTFRELVLIRHAKSSRDDPALDDFERPLSPRGKRDAPEMGERLKARGCVPDFFLSSPARRARKTAGGIARALDYAKGDVRLDARLYMRGVEGLCAAVREIPDERRRTFLVGHNPDLTAFAEWLSGVGLVDIPTCGVVALRLQVSAWRAIAANTASLLFFDYPKRPPDAGDGFISAG